MVKRRSVKRNAKNARGLRRDTAPFPQPRPQGFSLGTRLPFPKSCASYIRFARFNTSALYYLRAWHRLAWALLGYIKHLPFRSVSTRSRKKKKIGSCSISFLVHPGRSPGILLCLSASGIYSSSLTRRKNKLSRSFCRRYLSVFVCVSNVIDLIRRL